MHIIDKDADGEVKIKRTMKVMYVPLVKTQGS